MFFQTIHGHAPIAGRRLRKAPRGVLCLVLLLLTAACAKKGPKQPQVAHVPEGMLHDANLESARLVLPGFELLDQDGWMSLNEPHRSIVFSEFEEVAAEEDVINAVTRAAARYTSAEYGEIEPLTIDRRPAWGWFERQYIDDELAGIQFAAVIPYEDRTWTVEYYVSEPGEADTDESLRNLVGSFRWK
jgi:hypothetical protein